MLNLGFSKILLDFQKRFYIIIHKERKVSCKILVQCNNHKDDERTNQSQEIQLSIRTCALLYRFVKLVDPTPGRGARPL